MHYNRMEELVKEYESQTKRSHKEMRGAKETQGILIDKIKEYEKKCQNLALAYNDLSQKILRMFPTNP